VSPKRLYTPEDDNFQTAGAKLIGFGINLRYFIFILNVPNNYCFSLHKLVKYLRFVGGMHPAVHTLHDVKSVGKDIPSSRLPVLPGHILGPVF
jgi:hypothetical protein